VTLGAGLLTLLLLAVVFVVISGPLRTTRVPRRRDEQRTGHGAASPASAGAPPQAADLAALEAAREAKYRDLREAELDYRTGKLSSADYEAVLGRLREEALEILDALESLGGSDLEQQDRVREEQERERDRPAVEVALDHRAAAERPRAAADAERAGEAGVLTGVHQHEQHERHREEDLEDG
jgi:hypothetical protein